MFELVSRRYQNRSTLITTNRPFAEWREVFPNAACVVSLIDRLIHNAEIVAIDGESYRLRGRGQSDESSRTAAAVGIARAGLRLHVSVPHDHLAPAYAITGQPVTPIP